MSLNLYTNQQLMSKEMKKKFTKTFDLSQIAEDPMDSYLDTLGLWKKRIARDGSCLFRAVAEQIYPCQLHHERVRQECIRYMTDHKDDFSKFLTSITFEEYLDAMKNPLEYAGQLEIAAMSKLYNRDFIIYQHPDQPGIDVTQNGYEKKIYLCYSYNNHFDAIFTKTHRDCLALIQSFVYEILYDKVFGSGEQVAVARRLLRKSDTIYPKEYMRGEIDYDDDDSDLGNELDDEDSSDSIENIDFEESSHHSILMTDSVNESNLIKRSGEKTLTEISEETEASSESTTDQNNNEIKSSEKSKLIATSTTTSTTTITTTTQLNAYNLSYSDKSNIQKMPLPYKVAKSLDPVIYRNTAFDAWQAAKKEHEEAVNQKAISILQTGDKCLVKLNNNYSEKWNLAYVQNIQQDIANVFVVELNENHCVGLENLKPYKNGNEMSLLHHQNSFGFQANNSMLPVNNIQNVHKLVQSINAQFSKIFVNIDNKRRNVKKKQFNSMKKSSSFHAFSTELPTLIEVEEQLVEQDPFHYGHHYYLNNPHNQPMYHTQSHHHHHHQQQHSLPHHSMGYHASQPNNNPMNNQFGYISNANNASYSSLPHSQVFNEFNDSNKPKLANSLSANNLNQFNNMQNSLPGQSNAGGNNINSNASNNRNNRRPRYPQNANMNFPFNGPFNNAIKQPWNSNFLPGPMGPHPAGFLPPPPLLHHQMQGGQHLPNQPFNAGMGPMGPQQLAPNQGFMQPPPPMGQMHGPNGPMPNVPFIHQGPPPQMPMPPHNHPQNGPSSVTGHRPNFFNPISSFMFGPPPAPHSTNQTPPTHLNHNQGHSLDHINNNYYFPSANTNTNQSQNSAQHNSNKSQINNNLRNRNEKINTSSDTFNNNSNSNPANNNKQMIQGQATSNGYQQVPQHLQPSQVNSTSVGSANSGLLSMPPPTTTASSNNDMSHPVLPNTSNYLLMPAPQPNNNTSANTNNSSNSLQQQHDSGPSSSVIVPPVQSSNYNSSSNNSMTKSHSYHAGVSAQSYDVSNSNSNSVYVDVYNNNNNSGNNNNNNNTNNNNTNVPNILPGTVNPHNNLLVQANNMNNTNNNNNNSNLIGNTNAQYPGNNTNMGSENSNYGTNTFQNYEVQYPRFENNGFPANQNGLLDENLTGTTNMPRHNNLWNKGNKLTKNNSLFNDMVYTENTTGNNSLNLQPNSTQNNSQYYTNCFVVNIDGPINFNATHSLLDDGSDLPMSDYYRLNLATPYNQGQNYYAPSSVGTVAGTNQMTSSTNLSSSQNTAVTSGTSGSSTKLKEEGSISNSTNSASNSHNGHVNQQQVVPQTNLNKPLIQHSYTSRRVAH